MRDLTLDYFVKGTGGELYAKAADDSCDKVTSVVIDSRNVTAGSMFFCILGERVDGHDFLPDVRERGCHTVVVSNTDWAAKMQAAGDMNVILVKDTTRALMDLAICYMDDWQDLIRVGVTGSAGKTGTKEFIYSVVSSKYRTAKTRGNLNSNYGIPLSVFEFDLDAEVAIIEMGAGEGSHMSDLSEIVKPDIAVITNVGNVHKVFFGGREGLFEEKLKVAAAMQDGVLIINTDSDILSEEHAREYVADDIEIRTVGTAGDEDYYISDIVDNSQNGVVCNVSSCIGDDSEEHRMELPVVGVHNLTNAAEALAVGEVLGIELDDAIAAIVNFEHVGKRLEFFQGKRATVINDTYNASPEAMIAALRVLENTQGERRVAILGSMGELGEDSSELHANVGRIAAEIDVDLLIAVGDLAIDLADGARQYIEEKNVEGRGCHTEVMYFKQKSDLQEQVDDLIDKGDVVLLKASRSMELESVAFKIAELD